MMDNMDVAPSSGLKRASMSPPPSSSTEKRPKVDLPLAQLDALNDMMKNRSRRQMWQTRIENAGNDSQWRELFLDILMYLTDALAATDLKGSVIAPRISSQADEIVKGFTEKEEQEWKDGVRKGVKEGDWADLIAHRTSILHLRI
jgi:hypothetical protein